MQLIEYNPRTPLVSPNFVVTKAMNTTTGLLSPTMECSVAISGVPALPLEAPDLDETEKGMQRLEDPVTAAVTTNSKQVAITDSITTGVGKTVGKTDSTLGQVDCYLRSDTLCSTKEATSKDPTVGNLIGLNNFSVVSRPLFEMQQHQLHQKVTTSISPVGGMVTSQVCPLMGSLEARKIPPMNAPTGNKLITNELRLNVVPNTPKDVYRFSSEEVADVEMEWCATLIGVLVGARSSLQGMSLFMEKHWKIPQFKVFLKDNGVWVFKYNSLEDRLWVLENGPWLVGGCKPLILKAWKTGEAIDWTSFKLVPVWAKIVDIDLMLLSFNHMREVIGKMIGKLISIDRITNEVEKLSFARILVEVSLHEIKRDEVMLESYNRTIYKHKVEFKWVPRSCETCNLFGHLMHS